MCLSQKRKVKNIFFFSHVLFSRNTNDDMLFPLLAYRFKSSNFDTVCPISSGLCPSPSAQFAERGRRKRKKQSTGSSLSVCLASTSQFFLLRPC